MKLCNLIGLLCLCAFSKQEDVTSSVGEEPDVYLPPSEWSDTFDWKLLKAFSSNHRNVLISPISLKLVLALLYEGSEGQTHREFQSVLQFNVDQDKFRESYHKILQALQTNEQQDYLIRVGIRMFLDSEMKAKQRFADTTLRYYEALVQPTNFSYPEEASQKINSWVNDLTLGKITNLVSPGDLQDAVMVLANAIHFKGTWRHQFPKNSTAMGGFYLSANETVDVPYMTTTDVFYYFESDDLDAKILRLPYKGRTFSLFVVLPRAKEGLGSLIKRVNLVSLKTQLYMMDKVPVEVHLPKFKFRFQAKYAKILQEFGLRTMFQNTASFTKIASKGPNLQRFLTVSNIIQKSGIEVDEEGSVAYASTDVQVGNKFGEVDYIFNATHPFLFFLEEHTTGSILFIGKVDNPLDHGGKLVPVRIKDNENTEEGTLQQSLAGSLPDLQPSNPERDALISRFNYFDLELLKEFSELPGNLFISPASIKTTLALILEGAKGKNAQEISDALRIGDINQKDIREILHRLLFDLTDRSTNTVLEAANALFVSNKYTLVPDYEKIVAKYYKANVQSLDFTRTNDAINVINSWVGNSTHGFIRQIVGNQNLFPDTSLVIANALYFKGNWKTAFDPKSTKEKCFSSPSNSCVKTLLMQVSDTFNYNFNARLNAHAIELPYQDDKYSMLILLPNNGSSVRTLASDMQHTDLNVILDTLKPNELILEIPKFEIDFSADLVQYLKRLKIQGIFDNNANLPGIVTQDNIKVNNIIHKTRVEVNEQGTKAAAATAAVVVPLMGTTAQKITADHPFIFFIYQKDSRNIIFEGLFAEPAPTQVPNPVKTGHIQRYPLTRSRSAPSPYGYSRNNGFRYQ